MPEEETRHEAALAAWEGEGGSVRSASRKASRAERERGRHEGSAAAVGAIGKIRQRARAYAMRVMKMHELLKKERD